MFALIAIAVVAIVMVAVAAMMAFGVMMAVTSGAIVIAAAIVIVAVAARAGAVVRILSPRITPVAARVHRGAVGHHDVAIAVHRSAVARITDNPIRGLSFVLIVVV